MKGFSTLVSTGLALTATLANAAALLPRQDDATGYSGVTIFAASEGFGASYIRFHVQNNADGVTDGALFSVDCSAVSFPPDPVNGGPTPAEYVNGGVQGGCSNPNATWTWDGSQFETVYTWDSGDVNQSGIPYICRSMNYADANDATLTAKTFDYGTAKVAAHIPFSSATAVC